jgi:hypothetical protein
VGSGGAGLYNFTAVSPYIVDQIAGHGFLNVEINSSSKESKLTGTFIENIDVNTKDQFSITKQK